MALKTIEVLQPIKDLIHTITADNGKEFAKHQEIAEKLEISFYSLLRIIVCHYYLRCSYQLHGSVMATKSFLTCLNLQILRQKIHIAIYTSPCVNMSVSVYPVSSFREEMGFVIFRYKCNEFNWNEQLFSLQFMNKASPYFLVFHAHCIRRIQLANAIEF